MDYVPTKNADYKDWQSNLVATVSANAVTWGIQATLLALLVSNSDTYTALYNAIKNRPTRTPQQVTAYNTYKKTYTKFLRGFVQGQLVNNALIPVDELVGMGLNPHLYIRTERAKITTAPNIAFDLLGGGEVRFRCTMPASDSKGRHPDSDGVELFYAIEPLSQQVNPIDPKPGDQPIPPTPNSKAEFLPSIFSPRATFIHAFGINKVGLVLRVYGRWVNTSKPANNGTFSIIFSTIIS